MTSTAIATAPVAPAVPQQQPGNLPRQRASFLPQTYEQALDFAERIARTDLAPKDFRGKPDNCFVAMQWGAILGMDPITSLQGIAVINGRPALWGDAMLGCVLASPHCEYVREENDGNVATCRVKRKGKNEIEHVRTFSIEDARAAGLLGKPGPWQQYQRRMLQMRARGFALRDVFADVLRGLDSAEELSDSQPDVYSEQVVTHQPAAIPQATPVPSAPPSPPAREEAASPAPAAAPEAYPQDRFDENFEKWADLIRSGKKTAEGVVAFVESKGALLTQEQKAQLLAVQQQGEGSSNAGSEALFE